jgi:hypothetical protein
MTRLQVIDARAGNAGIGLAVEDRAQLERSDGLVAAIAAIAAGNLHEGLSTPR